MAVCRRMRFPKRLRALLDSFGMEHLSKHGSGYIAFVDSDDYVDPNYLSHLYEMCKNDGADIAMCAMNRCPRDSGEGVLFESGFKVDFSTKDIISVLKRSSFAPWNKLYRSSLWGALS